MALSLGPLTIQSALGEQLQAEIDIPDINADEASSLRASVAPPEAFRAAGLEYNSVIANLQATLQRRPDGRAFIRLSSDRPVNEPFVDLILEANWSSGRIVRDYTMLFDPPVLRKAPAAPTLPQTTTSVQPAPAVQTPATTAPSKSVRSEQPSNAATRNASTAKAAQEGASQVTVKAGDTASKIAGRAKSNEVSLDQMLVALLRSNPDAFIQGNINRIRAGAVINIPSTEQALSVPAMQANQIVVAQSKDFNAFRRSLASSAPVAAVNSANRKASGSIDATVEDKKPAAAIPDKLTLSKGATQDKANSEKIAKEQAEKDAAARAAEITRNISDLTKLGAASAPVASTAAANATAASAPLGTPEVAVAAAVPSAPASASVEAVSAPLAAASEPQTAASAVKKPPVVAALPEEPPGLLDELLENPLVPIGAAGLIALLGGFAFYRIRQRKKNSSQVDSSFLESRLQPDSFFGASGGQRVDTNNEGSVSGSSMVYSPSQLDAADDVDPVAEADVYLAYGRDLQAEEILKEAVRTTPGRLAIHTKLLEIFAKRRDAKSFENSATQAYKITGGNSPDWVRICELGLSFDPSNPMYQPGGSPANTGTQLPDSAASTFGSTAVQSAHPELPSAGAGVDLDLDLDFSLDDEPASAISDITGGTVTPVAHDQTVKLDTPDLSHPLEMDFDISGPAPLTSSGSSDAFSLPDISTTELDLPKSGASGTVNFDATGPMSVTPAVAAVEATDSGMLEFDLGSLSLDLDPPAEVAAAAISSENENPLETKLALAEEFVSIGDEDGARALIEEVVAEASGEMRTKAQRALANLG